MSWQGSDLRSGGTPVQATAIVAESRWRWLWLVGTALSVSGVVASVVTLYRGFVAFQQSGGSCASGGPFLIARHCSSSEIHQLFYGILGILVSGAAWAAFTAALRGPAYAVGLLIWVMVFGSLGYGFRGGREGLVPGITFELLAAGGLAPLLGARFDWLRRGGRPEPPPPGPTIVRAAVPVPVAAPAVAVSSAQDNNGPVPRRIVPPGGRR